MSCFLRILVSRPTNDCIFLIVQSSLFCAIPAGVQWTGKISENVDISAGRLCTIKVTVEQRAPISYVLPYIRKTLMGYTEPELNRLKEAG
jgi:hypothetical protein